MGKDAMNALPRAAKNWPAYAQDFVALFARIERRLKDAGKIKRGKKIAEADWTTLSDVLGPNFFDEIRRSGQASNLIAEPPRTKMAAGLVFSPENPCPLENVRDLLIRGVCRVRNNIVHGEKFDISGAGWERDEALTRQAHWVLLRAMETAAQSDQVFKPLQAGASVPAQGDAE
jgi:hypothetical protein